MTTPQRTDIHRPSAIIPDDYQFVGLSHIKIQDLGDALFARAEWERIRKHMDRTGGVYSSHSHGGTCHICGTHCQYTAVFYHPETNKYIKTGLDCAEKMHMGDPARFKQFRKSIQDALQRKAGKAKAKAILDVSGISRAWDLYEARLNQSEWEYEEETTIGIVDKLIRYGNISEKQISFVKSLLDRIDRRAEIKAQREAERALADDCPEGRIVITGTVVKTAAHDSDYGTTYKMTVKDDRGFLVWGTIPSALDLIEYDFEEEHLSFSTWVRLNERGQCVKALNEATGKKRPFWSESMTPELEAACPDVYSELLKEYEEYKSVPHITKRQRGLGKKDRVRFTATVTASDTDPKFGFFKRPSKASVIEASPIND